LGKEKKNEKKRYPVPVAAGNSVGAFHRRRIVGNDVTSDVAIRRAVNYGVLC
jgi:hypothetical protein